MAKDKSNIVTKKQTIFIKRGKQEMKTKKCCNICAYWSPYYADDKCFIGKCSENDQSDRNSNEVCERFKEHDNAGVFIEVK